MTIHPFDPDAPPSLRPQQERPDSVSSYDTTWAEQPASQAPEGLDRVMGAEGKIYVVLAVVLIIWVGLLYVLFRTDRKIDRLERRLDQHILEEDT